jgi:uncharacterized protein YdeI (YjbR/CyaY-like superfamily)
MLFETRADFRNWLIQNSESSEGIWLVFGKNASVKTIKANEALEEALCFGWIDGQMQSVDETSYLKYFAQRRKGSKWSDKNKETVKKLESIGLMTEHGRKKIEEAKENGMWDALKPEPISDAQIGLLALKLKDYEPAFSNFMAMSPSVKRNYAGLYFDAKSDEAKQRRFVKIILRLNQNLKPM